MYLIWSPNYPALGVTPQLSHGVLLVFRFRIVALHSTLSSKDQAAAFTVPPAGVRKVLRL